MSEHQGYKIHTWKQQLYRHHDPVEYEEYSCAVCGQHLGTMRNGKGKIESCAERKARVSRQTT